MKKKLVAMFSTVLLAGTLANVGTAYANNYKDATFKFRYSADGSDVTVAPAREKMDNTATYVKLTSNSIDLMMYVCGTNSPNKDTGLPDMCSTVVFVPKGDYRYISNTVYGKYKYAYLRGGSDIKGIHLVEGRWSPDNISGRY